MIPTSPAASIANDVGAETAAIRLQADGGGGTLTLASMGEEISRICAGLMTDADQLTPRDLEIITTEV